jgi:hypothetical protein
MRNSRTIITLGIMSLLILAGGVWTLRDAWGTKGFALRQETPEWTNYFASNNFGDERQSGILMRYSSNEGGILLLKHTKGPIVYNYDPSEHRTGRATAESWDQAKGQVVDCADQRWNRESAFNVDNMRYRLTAWDEDQTPYDTYGKYAWDAVVSPSKRKAAVLSAAGPKRPFFNFGFIFGGGDVHIHGQRYVQIMDLQSKQYVDKAVKLYAESDEPCFSSCWSSDEKVLVSYNCNFADFQIVAP